jgi:dGTPase
MASRQFSDFVQTAHLEPLNVPSRDLPDEVRSDSARIIPMPPFPRLQAEARILSHEINSGVKTQPAHPMKVALSGRILAGSAFKSLCQRGMIEKELRVPFISTGENACLLHDIGNPAFGHFGEFTIPASARPVIMGGL